MVERQGPAFTVDEGAPSDTGDAFIRLGALVIEHPHLGPALFDAAGDSTGEVLQTAQRLDPRDNTYRARAVRQYAEIFRKDYDKWTDLGAVASRAARGQRESVSSDVRRVIYVSAFVGQLADSEIAYRDGQTATPPEDTPVPLTLRSAA